MKRTVCIMVTAVLLAAGMIWSTGAATASMDSEGSGLIGTMIMGRVASLHLTDQQKAELKAVLMAHGPTLRPLINQYVSERRALRGLMGAEPIDEAAIRAQVAKIATTGSDLAVQRAHIMRECRAILTPDQVAKLRTMQEKRDARIDRFLTRVTGAQ